MAAKWIEALTGPLEQKKQYRQDKARIEALPEPYRTAAKAIERYLMVAGGIVDGATLVTMFGDLADLWERAAAASCPGGTSPRSVPSSLGRRCEIPPRLAAATALDDPAPYHPACGRLSSRACPKIKTGHPPCP